MTAPALDPNCASHWFPLIAAAGLPVPETHIIAAPRDIYGLLDGVTPTGWEEMVAAINAAGDEVGWPCFLRTGHTSGKHRWRTTCWLERPGDVEEHLVALVEDSMLSSLPVSVWLIRQVIDVDAMCRCEAYHGMPVVREFRVFAHSDGRIEHLQPYWPPGAVANGRPDNERWKPLLDAMSRLGADERGLVEDLARRAAAAVGGFWSVDILQAADGSLLVTDMAIGEDSYRWTPTTTTTDHDPRGARPS